MELSGNLQKEAALALTIAALGGAGLAGNAVAATEGGSPTPITRYMPAPGAESASQPLAFAESGYHAQLPDRLTQSVSVAPCATGYRAEFFAQEKSTADVTTGQTTNLTVVYDSLLTSMASRRDCNAKGLVHVMKTFGVVDGLRITPVKTIKGNKTRSAKQHASLNFDPCAYDFGLTQGDIKVSMGINDILKKKNSGRVVTNHFYSLKPTGSESQPGTPMPSLNCPASQVIPTHP